MKTLAFLLLTPSLVFSQTVYKCPDTNGSLKLQQLPCEGGSEVVIKPISNGKGASAKNELDYARNTQEEKERTKKEEADRIYNENARKAIERTIKEKVIVNGKSYRDRGDSCGNLTGMELTNCLNDVLTRN